MVEKSAQLRRNTFSSGRHCARKLLETLGQVPIVLLRNADGSVAWPEGFTGSVSHTNEWAVAGVAVQGLSEAKSIGIDLETVRPIGHTVLKHISTEREREDLGKSTLQTWHVTALFGLKESVYKCLRPAFGSFIRFHDVEITNIASGRPRLTIVNPKLSEHCESSDVELRLAVTPSHVFSLAWRQHTNQK
ncbi:MAG: phosphopantetheine--protein transferase-like protein [Porticoccaceae bacterium]|jgi:phosphopantetheine--protein transferase-like protein